jgi:hypothetical protein
MTVTRRGEANGGAPSIAIERENLLSNLESDWRNRR